MRQQQNNQNRRMRGRGPGGGNGGGGNSGGGGNNNNNNNRKGPNPLTRSYESNGPDVKVRGTAQHVAEKYMTLARDAQSSGDRVMAENYLQHAEHYNRIIAAAYAANPPQFQQNQNEGEEDNSMDGDSRFQSNPMPSSDNNAQQPYDGNAPQPVIEGVPAEVALGEANAPRPQADAEDQERRPSRNRRPRGPRPAREDGDQPDGGEAALSALPDFIVQRAPASEPVTADE
jgi:Domain of unknown function (DUF4167)